MKRTIFVLLSIILLLTGCRPTEETTERSPAGHEVAIDAGEYAGRGSVFLSNNDSVIIVTAWHLVSGAEESEDAVIRITFSDQTYAAGQVLLSDKERDLCFLTAPYGEKIPEIEEGTLAEEDPVFLFDGNGDRHSGFVTALKKDVAGVGRGMLTVACRVEAGMSGCGIYNADGQYVGMLVAGDEEGNAVGIPAGSINAFYSERRDEE